MLCTRIECRRRVEPRQAAETQTKLALGFTGLETDCTAAAKRLAVEDGRMPVLVTN